MVDENDLELRFSSVVRREAVQRSIMITPDGAACLESFIHCGVSKLLADGSVNDQSIELAESNLIKFMTQTSALSKALSEEMTPVKGIVLDSPRLPELNKTIFMRSKISICPCWPFC